MRTKQAAQYLCDHGLQISASTLTKLRCRGFEDPRDRGPDFSRDPNGYCDYSAEALDVYRAKRLGARQFRAHAPQPPQFRMQNARRVGRQK